MTGSAIDRLTPGDMVVLASDVGPAPAQVAVLLDLEGRGDRVAADITAVLGQRLVAIPPLLQHPARVGPFQGRPVWVRDRDLDVGRHLRTTRLETIGVQARLDAAATLMTRRLTLAHPPWRFDVLVQPDGSVAVAAVMHHVVADGMRGLSMLAGLTDEGGTFPAPEGARADLPPGRTLALDAAREHVRAVASVVRPSGTLTALREELKHGRPPSAPQTSLNRPTGAGRRVAALDRPLGPLLEAAHAHGATVNDLLLVAVVQALGAELGRRGEHPDRLVVSVPVALTAGLRPQAGAGNAVGVMPVEVPLVGELRDRLAVVAARTRERRDSARSGSAELVGPAFRLLGWLGAFRSVATRQRVVNTFVSNMRGPVEPLHIAGHAVTRVVPMGAASGNIGVQALALSCAGALTIAVVHDPDLLPDAVPVVEDLSAALAALT